MNDSLGVMNTDDFIKAYLVSQVALNKDSPGVNSLAMPLLQIIQSDNLMTTVDKLGGKYATDVSGGTSN